MSADELLRPWLDPLLAGLADLTPLDVHTHIGSNDPDGYRSAPDELMATLGRVAARAFVFPMHEPAGYPPANDAVLAAAASSGDRLVPFCRVDPAARPVQEAERCLDAGARGIKLHPRAEGFELSEPAAADVIELAGDRRVPVLIHAGRGIPALGRDALGLCSRFPNARLILAHAGISDLSWLWRHAANHPNLLFDTAWWNPADLLALFALVPPGQIVFGSDAPYGTTLQAAVLTLRCAYEVGLSSEQARGVMGEQAQRLAAGKDVHDLGRPPGQEGISADVLLERVFAFLSIAANRLLHGESADQELALARLACEVGDAAPQARTCRSVLALLDRRERLLASGSGAGGRRAPGTHLVVIAAGVAKTPSVALPLDPEPVEVGEREP